MKVWILQNQMRTEKQMRAAALRHEFFFSLRHPWIKFEAPEVVWPVLTSSQPPKPHFDFKMAVAWVVSINLFLKFDVIS